MHRLKTTTILITSLALAMPVPGFAGSNADVQACIAAHLKAGESRGQAQAACQAQSGASTPKSGFSAVPGLSRQPEPNVAQPKTTFPSPQPEKRQPQATQPKAQQPVTKSWQPAPPKVAQPKVQQPAVQQPKVQQPKLVVPKPPQPVAPPVAQPKFATPQRGVPTPAPPAPEVIPAPPAPGFSTQQTRPAKTPKIPRTPPAAAVPDATAPTAAAPATTAPATTAPVVPLLPGARTPPAPAAVPPAGVPDGTLATPAPAAPASPWSAPASTAPAPAGTKTWAPSASRNVLRDIVTTRQGTPVTNDALVAPAGPGPDGGVSTQEEVITRDNARSSAQDFATMPNGRPRPDRFMPGQPYPDQRYPYPGQPEYRRKKDSGLSDIEKLAIVGIAALAVGTLLSNGSRVASNSGDRVVVQYPDGSYHVIKDDNALLRQPGSTIRTQDYPDGSSRTVVTRPDGSQIITIYDPERRIVQRVRIDPYGRRYVLIDDSRGAPPVRMSSTNPGYYPPAVSDGANDDALRQALAAEGVEGRRYTLAQIRDFPGVRALAPVIGVENITFASGSSAIDPDQAHALAGLGATIRDAIAADPREIFLIEGHTDAVGDPAMNLTLSDRRAESLALALSEYFDVPAENLVVQGYGEQELAVQTAGPSAENRRVEVRRITDLLQVAQE